MGFTCGIIGLPNVGKSTIFNAITSAKAAAENFPFCTIEPNTGAVPVPDPRIEVLANIAGSAKLIPALMTFVDIAGLIRGASKGEGLGNQFLGHIRSVDAVAHVVRCFDDPNIVHVEGKIDPVNDIETIETELILSDLDSVTKLLQKIEKMARSGDKDAKKQQTVLQELEKHLSNAKPARTFLSPEAQDILPVLTNNLLTAKPTMFVGNVAEEDAGTEPNPNGSRPIDKLAAYCKEHKVDLVVISGKVESEIAELPKDERVEYLKAAGLSMSGLDKLTIAGYKLLGLMTFFTIGPKEAHAWTIKSGTSGPQAAGKIHTDFEKGFIRAEVISYNHYVEDGGEVKAREKGHLRTEGKEYVMQDGDIVHFRFNL